MSHPEMVNTRRRTGMEGGGTQGSAVEDVSDAHEPSK